MPTNSPHSLHRDKRLRKRREFIRVQRWGARSFGRFFVVISQRKQTCASGRFGITVPKKVGPANVRNKTKRRVRHILRTNPSLFVRQDLVIIARQTAVNANFDALTSDLTLACRRLGTQGRSFQKKNNHSPKKP